MTENFAHLEINPFEYLTEHRLGRMTLPLVNDKILRLDCVAIAVAPPVPTIEKTEEGKKEAPQLCLETEFLPDKLPVTLINLESDCLIHFEIKGIVLSMVCAIKAVELKRRLKLTVFEASTYAQKRRFFRVETELSVELQYFADGIAQAKEGTAINISGGGMLVAFQHPLEVKHGIWLEISLPEPEAKRVRCIAQVVRVEEEKDDIFLVGFNFEKVRPQDQDALVSFCYEMQRQHLRLKVRILGGK